MTANPIWMVFQARCTLFHNGLLTAEDGAHLHELIFPEASADQREHLIKGDNNRHLVSLDEGRWIGVAALMPKRCDLVQEAQLSNNGAVHEYTGPRKPVGIVIESFFQRLESLKSTYLSLPITRIAFAFHLIQTYDDCPSAIKELKAKTGVDQYADDDLDALYRCNNKATGLVKSQELIFNRLETWSASRLRVMANPEDNTTVLKEHYTTAVNFDVNTNADCNIDIPFNCAQGHIACCKDMMLGVLKDRGLL